METWIIESLFQPKFFPEISTVYRSVALNYVAEELWLLFLKQFLALNVDPTLYKLCSADYVKPNFIKLVIFYQEDKQTYHFALSCVVILLLFVFVLTV
jgi:hypothetical protein